MILNAIIRIYYDLINNSGCLHVLNGLLSLFARTKHITRLYRITHKSYLHKEWTGGEVRERKYEREFWWKLTTQIADLLQVSEGRETHMNSQKKSRSRYFRLDQTDVFIFLLARLPLVLFSLSEPSESSAWACIWSPTPSILAFSSDRTMWKETLNACGNIMKQVQ